jgi:hypothetical protein
MDRAVRALCWRPFVRQIGHTDALIMDVMHQIKAYLRKKFGHTRKRSAKAQSPKLSKSTQKFTELGDF